MHDVVRATTLAKMLYASQAWWGFTSQKEREALEVVLRRLIRGQYLPSDILTIEQQCLDADYRLFSAVQRNQGHVLHDMLPPKRHTGHGLRPRAHDREIPSADCLTRKTFIIRMIYQR